MSRRLTSSIHVAIVLIALAGAVVSAAGLRATQGGTALTLKDRIEFGLETSDVVRKYDIRVKVTGTEVILTGTVATVAQKAEAARLAKVAGATKIQDAIVVDKDVDVTLADKVKAGLTKTGEKITDVWITTKVKWFYLGDEGLKGSDISVSTKDRVVTLSGTVKTQASRTRAVTLATNAEGVKRVIDTMTIAR